MNKLNMRETFSHHAMAVAGGFFGIYALLLRQENFGSSETANLIYLFAAGLRGDRIVLAIRIGAMFCYIGGVIFATLVPKCMKGRDFRYVSIAVDIICCVILARIPEEADPVLALYPMFFATAVQWLAFSNASGFNSSTIFSTNNVRQCFAGLTEYCCSHERKYALQAKFFGGTLICFHLGVVYAYFCMQLWGIQSSYACIPLVLIGLAGICSERAYSRDFRKKEA